MTEHAIVVIAGIGILAILCQWLAWWVKLPAILFLLLTGILVGPVLGWLAPAALFGDLLFPFISLSVAVILFEGALTLRLEEIRGVEQVVRRLVSGGLLVTWAVATLAVHVLIGFSWDLAILFGAITTVTGPTVIVPLLRTVRPTAHLARILRWEGILIDPIGALLAVLVFEFIVSGTPGEALGHTFKVFTLAIATGVGIGVLAGYGLGLVLRRYLLPEYLHNVAALTVMFGAFAWSDHLQGESGLIAVTVMGVWLANMKGVYIEEILDFKESLSVLLISGLFILLAARLDLSGLLALGWPAIGVLLAMQFIARPAKVLVATWGTKLTWRERALLAWIAPRGIVAAAVSALFAIRLGQQGYADAPLLVAVTFLVIIGTVVLQSATARPLANWLGVAEPEPRGFLIVGANPLARTIAKALEEQGFDVLLADTRREYLRAAHMAALPTYFGDVTSQHADRHLDLVGLGHLLALSVHPQINALAALRYRAEFGNQRVFILPSEPPEYEHQERISDTHARRIFGGGSNYQRLTEMLALGARIHITRLSETFDFHDYYRKHFRHAVPLFTLDARNRLHVFTEDAEPQPGPGWRVIALVEQPEEETTQVGGQDEGTKPAG